MALTKAERCRRKFLRFFPGGFRDETYIDWERGYKSAAHDAWQDQLGRVRLRALIDRGEHAAAAAIAVRIESRTNLLFSFLKPNVTRIAAREYGFEFRYASKPAWDTYASFLEFAATVRRDLRDLRPRDLIDIQSFMWVQGSDEYEE